MNTKVCAAVLSQQSFNQWPTAKVQKLRLSRSLPLPLSQFCCAFFLRSSTHFRDTDCQHPPLRTTTSCRPRLPRRRLVQQLLGLPASRDHLLKTPTTTPVKAHPRLRRTRLRDRGITDCSKKRQTSTTQLLLHAILIPVSQCDLPSNIQTDQFQTCVFGLTIFTETSQNLPNTAPSDEWVEKLAVHLASESAFIDYMKNPGEPDDLIIPTLWLATVYLPGRTTHYELFRVSMIGMFPVTTTSTDDTRRNGLTSGGPKARLVQMATGSRSLRGLQRSFLVAYYPVRAPSKVLRHPFQQMMRPLLQTVRACSESRLRAAN
jgi:hypothetical protein